eukprot:TRINITY_DN9926_c0_g1_i3.p1 TRINITY_DN9926_c0_g1~~TRINITY_DN9926_c0_g1_i3.p1  ORF type:complete len:593 (+),score=107.40 TRINITY_DN9926_c0_g1_i3:71-1849(+)
MAVADNSPDRQAGGTPDQECLDFIKEQLASQAKQLEEHLTLLREVRNEQERLGTLFEGDGQHALLRSVSGTTGVSAYAFSEAAAMSPTSGGHALPAPSFGISLPALGASNNPPAAETVERVKSGQKSPRLTPRRRSSASSMSSHSYTGVRGIIFHVVEHPAFEYFSAFVILLHSFSIGAYVEYQASVYTKVHPSLKILNYTLVGVFFFEVALKWFVERRDYLCGHERWWNLFDLLLASMVLFELPFYFLPNGKSGTLKSLVKVAEMMRTLRVLRIVRVLRFSRTLRTIVSKIFSLVAELVWVTVLFGMLIFVLAVCITQGVNEYFDGAQHKEYWYSEATPIQLRVQLYCGSVRSSAATLLRSVSGGILWGEVADLLHEVGYFYFVLFTMYIVLVLLSIMNIITGIFVDAAYQSGQQDRDMLEEKQHKINEMHAGHLREIFDEIDLDASGSIALDEFNGFVNDRRVVSYLDALGIDTSDATRLFKLLDADGSGEIIADEFVEGCLKLRGEAKSVDIQLLMHEVRKLRKAQLKVIEDVRASKHLISAAIVKHSSAEALASRPSVASEPEDGKSQGSSAGLHVRFKEPSDKALTL